MKPYLGGILGALMLFAATAPLRAYLDAPVEKLTLPELLKEFKSIELVKAGRVDLERGVVIWQHVKQLQGDGGGDKIKHLLHLRGAVPPALAGLKPGQTAVFFSRDGFQRGIVLTEGCWYVVAFEADSDCWRIAYTDRYYDFNTCFHGNPEQATLAIEKLLAGEEVVVQCRSTPKKPELQSVRYTMKHPHKKQ